jgi:ATP phosphoribosyltransferase
MNISDLTHNIVVASKFVNSATRYFRDRGIKATIVKLYGAIELAPLTGLSDVICDLSATGRTLKENSLKILDTVFTSTAHLIANPIGLKVHTKDIEALVQTLSHNHSKST